MRMGVCICRSAGAERRCSTNACSSTSTCTINASLQKDKCATSYIYTSHTTHADESCRDLCSVSCAYISIPIVISTTYPAHVHEPPHIFERIISHIYMRHISHMNESRPTNGRAILLPLQQQPCAHPQFPSHEKMYGRVWRTYAASSGEQQRQVSNRRTSMNESWYMYICIISLPSQQRPCSHQHLRHHQTPPRKSPCSG